MDRGYRGITQYEQTKIYVPKPNKKISKVTRRKHSRRAAIEPKIGHLKSDHRLKVNFLKGIIGDQMNIILAACALNFKRVMNLWITEAIYRWLLFYRLIQEVYLNCFAQKLKMGF